MAGESPFAGIGVVEAGSSLALRLCGKLLADAGAHVVRLDVEPDQLREAPHGDDWVSFLDRGKLPSTDAAAVLAESDVYLSSLAHGGELGCDAVLARYPDLTAACVTPFGQEGHYAKFAADDVVLCALCGLSDATPGLPDHCDRADEPPVQSFAALAETSGGLSAAVAVSAALFARLRGKPGPRDLECSTLESAAAMMVVEWGVAAHGGGARGRRPVVLDPAPNAYFPTRDGVAAIVAATETHWRSLVGLMGDPEWAKSPGFADGAARARNWDELEPRLRDWTGRQHGAELLAQAQARGIPIAVSLELAETIASDHIRESASVRIEDGRAMPADPIRFNGRRRGRAAADERSQVRERVAMGKATADDAAPMLAGVRVLDFGQFVAAPYCGQLLAALGAEVTIVEPTGVPISRVFGPFVGEPSYDGSAIFNQINRNKRSVQLDLTTDTGAAAAHALVHASDVVLENFSNRAVEKLGLTYDELSAHRADVIVASVSGFGRSGPWGDYVALHSGVLLLSGTASVTRDRHGRMRLAGAVYPDLLAGATMALAVIEALTRRTLTGEGAHVEIAMGDVMLNCMGGLLPAAARGQRFDAHPAAFLPTAEATGFLAVSDCVHPALAAEVAELPKRTAMERLQARGLRAAAVLDISEVMADPHLHRRGFVVTPVHPVTGVRPMPAAPWIVNRARPELTVSPRLGSSTGDVLACLPSLEEPSTSRSSE